ncbi:meiosis expressed gene 1 protein homolog [Dysidea avara]|uniref:meiosis expressed gene 1 protein homolog n=1 Tax=Dysidea avara TaxID=196820 RepID=UPI0033235BEF
MALLTSQPKQVTRAKSWDEQVEEAYRFQLAGYRDQCEYLSVQRGENIERWPHNGYIKKLRRKDGCFYYYNKQRECPDREVHKTKLYVY